MAVYLDVVSSGHREHDVDGDGWLGERTSTAIIVRGCSRLFEVVRACQEGGSGWDQIRWWGWRLRFRHCGNSWPRPDGRAGTKSWGSRWSLTIQAVVSKGGDGKIGWGVLSVGGEYKSATTQTVKLTLTPVRRNSDGSVTRDDFTIADQQTPGQKFGPQG